MGFISSWLLSVAGVVVLSVLAELMLPEGQMNKYVKIIFSFAIVLTVISPLPKIFGEKFDLNHFFSGDSALQEDYLHQVNVDKLTALGNDISADIQREGILKVQISIDADVLSENLDIRRVFVDLREIEYASNFGSKDITKAKVKICEVISSYALLRDVEVKFEE